MAEAASIKVSKFIAVLITGSLRAISHLPLSPLALHSDQSLDTLAPASGYITSRI